jgi:iron complex transport system ATP-binding protein
MIEISGLRVDLGEHRIVDDIDLKVPDGALVGLLGPNGSGKSTILKTLYRIHHPAAGRIHLDGQDLLALTPRAAARRVAVVAQEASVEFDATAADVVMIGRTPHQRGLARDTETDRAAVTDALARVGCAHLAGRSIHTLSGGERQRVHIARALAQGCDHLLLDEPTNHLDIRYQVEVLDLVASLGVTVLAALHDLSLAGLFCDHVYLLDRGRVHSHGRPREVITRAAVRDVYGADVHVVEHPEDGTPQLIPRRSTPASTHHRKVAPDAF